MGFFDVEGSIMSCIFTLQHDVGNMKGGWAIEVALFEDRISLRPVMQKQPIFLMYKQITNVRCDFEKDTIEKNKSTVGRAAAGGLLFGQTGAIVGAISGASGKKEQTVFNRFFTICYTSSSGDDASIKFQDTRAFKGEKLMNKLKELCEIKPNGKEEEKTEFL